MDHFSNLVEDLKMVYSLVEKDNSNAIPLFVMGHSLGGAVIANAICENKINPRGAILNAPVFELKVAPWRFMELPIYGLVKIYIAFGAGKEYAFGQKDCIPFLPFDTNDVTHSKYRFYIWRKHISEVEQMQLGGITFHFGEEIISASRRIRKMGSQNQTPTLILQAEEDTIVHNGAQDYFVQSCPAAKKVVCGHAKHEILMEIDFIRNKALDVIKNFIGV